MFRAVVVFALLAVAAAIGAGKLSLFPGAKLVSSGAVPAAAASSSKPVAVPKAAAVKAPAASKISKKDPLNAPVVNKKFGKDMTWGGRPNPTPEMIIDPEGAVDKSKGAWTLGWKN